MEEIMKTPHTSCKKGKTVRVVLRSGVVLIDKFVERTGKFVILKNNRLTGDSISSLSIYKKT